MSAAVPALGVHLLCLLLLSVLGLDASAAEIHRCTLDDGTVVFQDQKCQNGSSQVLRGTGRSGAISEARLREWLQQQPSDRPRAEPARPVAPAKPVVSSSSLPGRPQSEQMLAACSERVLVCAGEGPGKMDGCIARISRCSASRQQRCCAPPFVQRYQLLRDANVEQRDAVRGALLGVAGE